ncbi:hypothetical protein [Parabacteroides sp. PF5-9]|uniref:hypothetical protein n=1 Tax=Parabacteroides sp. PF5-9 TaxID=1742404 RepID=UPI002473BF72|nr:hypothetical protein [Parabacteroides sp. PF5-9]MDH6356205.1 hypothetical protein [Parabacteroides sp. PF5-9]
MNTENKKIDQLTTCLMKESFEEPSSSLNSRIMALIRKEKQPSPVYAVEKMPSISTLFIGVGIYLLVIIGLLSLFQANEMAGAQFVWIIKNSVPFILTVGSGISFFFFYGQLDNWLRRKEELQQKKEAVS